MECKTNALCQVDVKFAVNKKPFSFLKLYNMAVISHIHAGLFQFLMSVSEQILQKFEMPRLLLMNNFTIVFLGPPTI